MNEDEKYLFDLNGYLLLKEVLTEKEVARLNEGIDHHGEQMEPIDQSLAGGSEALEGSARRKDWGGRLARPLFKRICPALEDKGEEMERRCRCLSIFLWFGTCPWCPRRARRGGWCLVQRGGRKV